MLTCQSFISWISAARTARGTVFDTTQKSANAFANLGRLQNEDKTKLAEDKVLSLSRNCKAVAAAPNGDVRTLDVTPVPRKEVLVVAIFVCATSNILGTTNPFDLASRSAPGADQNATARQNAISTQGSLRRIHLFIDWVSGNV